MILTEANNFPTDLYVAQGLIRLLGRGHQLRTVDRSQLIEAIDRDVAVVMVTQTDYRSGAFHNMAEVTEVAHQARALALWDLSHSAGAMDVALDDCEVDLADGCGYKFLNGGPGAPAYLYVAKRHQDAAMQPLSGWFGHAEPFAFEPDYRPGAGISNQLCGTPSILAMAALEAGIDLMLEADMSEIRAQSMSLGEAFCQAVDIHCPGIFERAGLVKFY